MSEKHSKGTNLNLDGIMDLLSDIRDNISETQRAAEKPLNIKANSKEVRTANQEIESLLRNLNNIKKSNTLQKYFTDAGTAQKNLAKAYENYQAKIKSGTEKQAKQATADVARYANAFTALGGNPDVVNKSIKNITAKYMKTNNPSNGWLYGVDNFKEAFAIMRQIEDLAPGTFFKNISTEAEKAGDTVTQSVKKIKETVEGDGIAKNIFDSDEGEREANKLVETLDRIWAKVSAGNKELSSSEAIDFATAFHQLNYYLEQTPRKMDDARASLVDFKKFLADIYDFLPENQRSELTDFMSTPNGKVDQKAMLGIAIEYWQELAKEINQASDAQKNFYSNQFVEIPNLTEAQKEYRKLVEWVREYYELLQKSKVGNKSIIPYGDDPLSMMVFGGDTRRKNGHRYTTQASLKRLLADYDSYASKEGVSEDSKNLAIDKIAAYTYALDKATDAEKLFGKSHAELFAEVALRIKNAEEAMDAYNHAMSLQGLVASSAKSMGGNLVTYGDFDKFEKVLLSDGVEGSLKYLVETLGMELPEAVKEAASVTDDLTSSEKKAGEATEETATKDDKATESKKKKTEATKASAKAAEEEAKAEEEAARKAADAQKQREWNAKKIAQQLAEASERVYKSETHNANGSVTSTDYIDHFRTRTTKSGYDKNGDYYVLESTKENYVELEKQIQRNDKAITRLTKDMYLNAKAGADTSAWQNQIDALEEYNKVLLEIRNAGWVGSDENLPEEFHAEVFDTERLEAQEKDWESVIASAQKTLKRFITDAESIQSKPLMDGLATDVDKLVDNLKHLAAVPQIDFKNSNIDTVRNQVVEFLTTLRDLETELNVVSNQSRLDEFIPADINDVKTLDNNIMAFMDNNTAMSKEFKKALEAIHAELRGIIDTGEQVSKIRLNDLKGSANEVEAEVRRLHQTGNSFFRSFTKQLKSANAQFLATYFSFQDMVRYAREIVTTVTQIDSALTELRKVSDASTERLAQNFEVSAKTAKELGSSITHVINITADWARLGFNVDDAEELARVTTLFQNVGDNMSADDASSFMISTLKGFQLTADEAEHIADVYNEVANNFAIDTAGIGEALQRSAASFNAANTSLEGAISVITTANSVVQNPEMVGTAMKTLSARIRGSKVELEELGEEEEDVLNLSSKLRREVKAMTGFDIMEDEETYKTIDQIIIGIGKHWKELTDIQQAALAEDLAGKRNSNVLIALLQNAELVEQVYDKATHAAGSAAKEQQNYMMSIQYSLDRFTASMQELEADLVDSQLVKDIVDIGTVIVNILDEIVEHIGLLGAGASIAGIVALVNNFKELRNNFEAVSAIFKASKIADQAQLVEQLAVATEGLSVAQARNVMTMAGIDAQTKEVVLSRIAEAGATTATSVATDKLTASIWTNIKATVAWLATNPLGWLILAAGTIAAAVTAFDALTTSVEESKKKVDEYSKSVDSLRSELEQLRNLENKTPYDNSRIAYLEKELKLQERLLEIEQQRYYENLTERTFANSFDSNNIAAQQDRNAAKETSGGGTARYVTDLERQLKQLRKLDSEIEKVGEDSEKLEKLEDKRKKRLEKGDKLYSSLLNEYKTYAQQMDQLTEALTARTSSGYNMLTGKAREDAQKSLTYAYSEIKEITEVLRSFEQEKGEYDPFNVITGIESEASLGEIKRIVESSSDIESIQERLLAQFPSLESLCRKYGLTVKELVEHYWEEKEAIEAVEDAETKRASTLSTAVSNINSRIFPQFKELGEVYDEIFNGDKGFDLSHIGAEDLEGLRSTFEDLDEDLNIDWESKTEDVDKFLSVIGNSSSTASEVHNAFNVIATSYFNAAKASEDFTEENAKVLEQMLEEMGVVNANEVVMEELNAQMEVQANKANALAAASSDMAGATEDASLKFVQEAQMSNLAKVYLADLVATETVFNNTGLNVDDKVAALSELATAYFGTAAAAKLVEMTNNRGYDHSYSTSPEEAWRQIVGEMTRIEMPKIDFSKATSSAKGGGKDAGDAYVEAFEKELKALEEQRDAGIITEKQFLDKYKALIEKYFKDVDGYGEEYAKRMGDYFQRAISYYESIFSAVGTLLNKRISAAQEGKDVAIQALNDEKDAALAAYDAQIEAIEDQIDAKKEQLDLLDDEIDKIKDQVDAINDAADARKRDLDLQKAEFNLQRAMQQRNKLIYKDGQMVA